MKIFKDAAEAIEAGYVYRTPTFTGLRLTEAIVVREGTVEGNATVDLIFMDEKGNKYVAMTTQNLLKMLPA